MIARKHCSSGDQNGSGDGYETVTYKKKKRSEHTSPGIIIANNLLH